MSHLPENWILYISHKCPFCKRVTDFLADNNLSIKVVDAWQDEEQAEKLIALAGRRTVPYLWMGESGMHESLDIIERIREEAGL